MYYKCHTINFIRGGSYIETPDLAKKAAINQKNTDDKFFQYAATAALSYEVIGPHPERFSTIKTIKPYDGKERNSPSKIDSKIFEKNNPTIALNNLYIKKKEIFPAYISKINSNCEKK